MQVVREIQDHIQKNLFKGKVIIIYGARRVGKTTLVKQILKDYPESKYINPVECENTRFIHSQLLHFRS